MTAQEAISAIRQEIKRLNESVPYNCDRHDEGLHDAYHKALKVLDTLTVDAPEGLDEAACEIYPKISTIDMPNDEDRFTCNFINKEKREAFKAGAEYEASKYTLIGTYNEDEYYIKKK